MIKGLKRFLSSFRGQKPDISLAPQLLSELSKFRLPLIIVQISFILGTLGYLILEDYSIMDAFFQTSYTFTNTGFGSLGENEFGTITIIFTTLLMLIGAAFIPFCVASIINVFMGGRLISIMKEMKMINKIARLKNHYVIFYHNEFCIQLAKHFRQSHIPFVVVDPENDFEKNAINNNYPYYINDNPHTINAILKAHLSSAKGVICLSKNLTDNIALIAFVKLYQNELKRKDYNIISIADSDEDSEKLKKLGSHYIISPTNLAAQRINAIILKPGTENIIEKFVNQKENSLVLEEVVVPKYSWLVLRKIKEAHFREVTRAAIVGIEQKDGQYITMPGDDVLVTSECTLLVIGTANHIRQTKRIIMNKQKPEELKYV